jgi:HK97 family phage major capsid protein
MDPKLQEELKPIVEEIKTSVDESVKGQMQATMPAITEEVFKRLKEEIPNRKDIFGGDLHQADEQKEVKDGKEKAAEYIKAVFNRDSTQVKALSEGTAADGGYVVPETFSNEIIRIAPNYGVVRRLARNYPVSGDGYKTHLPTVGNVSVYRVNEKAKIPASQPTFGQANITIKKIAGMVPMSNELLKDANVDTVNIMTTLFGEAFAKYEDEWGVAGKAAGEGIFQNASVPVVTMGSGETTYATAEEDDLLDMMATIDEGALEGAKWLMSFSMLIALMKREDTTGRKLVVPPTAGTPASIWGIPIQLVRGMPKTTDGSQPGTKFLALANLDYMLFADKKEYELKISQEASITDVDGSTNINLFEQDMSAVRVIERIDIQLAEAAKAFVVLKTAAS